MKGAAMDMSYAQNLEDYYLAEAFAGQPSGFYVDVGAGHPVADNVSCWFYLQGWSGLVVEPQQDLAALYQYVRPRDRVAPVVLGRTSGDAAFYHVERLHGFSTTIASHADSARAFGADHRMLRVPMLTLAGLCDHHNVTAIDFLKIDVEGAEGDVLAGNDWTRFRPRVILAEALRPGDMAENWQDWEPFLLAQNYHFVLFDGLNRYYVAGEDTGLLERFAREAAPWLVVPHLGHTNRAPWRDDHPDHAFAKLLTGSFLAGLPAFSHDALLPMLTRGLPEARLNAPPAPGDYEAAVARLFPGAAHADGRRGLAPGNAATLRDLYRSLMESDAFRVMTGRLAMSFDGGQILD